MMKILIVDDNRDFAETMADLLGLHGYDTDVAFSGEEAIECFKTAQYDLAFMDVKLPGKNGVESFLEIKKLVPDCKVVMMTGYSVEQLLRQAINQGALEVLHKPFDTTKIIEIIDKIKPDGIILVVDDDPLFSESVKNLLEENGFKVFLAKDGQEAIDKVKSETIELVILDLRLPVMSGLEVYMELKKIGCVKPTLIVTGYAQEEEDAIKELETLNVSGILSKPFNPDSLIGSIRRLLA